RGSGDRLRDRRRRRGDRLRRLVGRRLKVERDHVFDLVLNPAELAETSPDRPGQLRELLRAHHDERDEQDDEQLWRSDVEPGWPGTILPSPRGGTIAASHPASSLVRRGTVALSG